MTGTPIVAIHGGAGTILRDAMNTETEAQYRAELTAILRAAQAVLAEGGSALDAVSVAVRMLEDCPLFNAGRGSVYTAEGRHELDAAIMDGATLAAGAVCCVTRVRNPVLAARRVMEASEHVMFAGQGADAFAAAQGLELVEPGYFATESRHEQWVKARGVAGTVLDHDAATLAFGDGAAERAPEPKPEPIDPDRKLGTVGAVALDCRGHLAAATSTGGITNKQPGRVGDTPIIGAGCYADDATCAVSSTGTGEMFIRLATAHDVAAQIAYRGASLADAAHDVVMNKLPRIAGRGGIIAVDAQGNVAMPFNTEGMYRGYARVGEAPVTGIYRGDGGDDDDRDNRDDRDDPAGPRGT
nr:isoaspartyl peptidase/L-asparaginase [Burkholderia guangdongensis]